MCVELVDEFNTHVSDSSIYMDSLNTSINDALDSLSADISTAVAAQELADSSLKDYVDFNVSSLESHMDSSFVYLNEYVDERLSEQESNNSSLVV